MNETIYLDLDESLTVSLGDARIAIDQDALARRGEVRLACWFVISE